MNNMDNNNNDNIVNLSENNRRTSKRLSNKRSNEKLSKFSELPDETRDNLNDLNQEYKNENSSKSKKIKLDTNIPNNLLSTDIRELALGLNKLNDTISNIGINICEKIDTFSTNLINNNGLVNNFDMKTEADEAEEYINELENSSDDILMIRR